MPWHFNRLLTQLHIGIGINDFLKVGKEFTITLLKEIFYNPMISHTAVITVFYRPASCVRSWVSGHSGCIPIWLYIYM